MEVAQLISELTGVNSEFRLTDPAVGDDPQRRRPDITKARELLGWRPLVPLREGLAQTIAYFREELGILAGGAELPAHLVLTDSDSPSGRVPGSV